MKSGGTITKVKYAVGSGAVSVWVKWPGEPDEETFTFEDTDIGDRFLDAMGAGLHVNIDATPPGPTTYEFTA